MEVSCDRSVLLPPILQMAGALLVKAGCDVNYCEPRTGQSALRMAVKKEYHVIVEQLLACERLDHSGSHIYLVIAYYAPVSSS